MKKSWYEIKNAAPMPVIILHGEIGVDFWGDGLSVSSNEFAQDLAELGSPKDIAVRINSPGGDVFEGQAIYSLLRSHAAKIHVKIDGIAASIASVIAMAGDDIEMPENATMMLHEPFGMVMGNSVDMRKFADTLDVVREGILNAYMTRASVGREVIAGMMAEETWLSSAGAMELGLATTAGPAVKMAACWNLDKHKFRNPPAPLLELEEKQRQREQGTPVLDGLKKRFTALQVAESGLIDYMLFNGVKPS